MKFRHIIIFLISAIIGTCLVACNDQVNSSVDVSGEWLIPSNQIFDGGPGRDGIPALSNPRMIGVQEANYLNDFDLVIGVKVGNEVRAYPHPILDWHEIINDGIAEEKFAITYCPLTGSGIGWNRIINSQETTFGVSGLLYNTNLIPYDRATASNWSQMKLQCVNGSLIGREPELFPLIETTWRTWKEMYANSKVVSTNTGFSKPYGQYPYGDYKTNHNRLIFPVNNDDTRLPRKERVLGIIVGGSSKAFAIRQFDSNPNVINENFNGADIVVVGSAAKNYAVAYSRKLPDGTVLTFEPIEGNLPVIMTDNEGNNWDIFGYAVNGPRTGQKLENLRSFISYWFAWGAFYPGADINGQ